MSTIPTNLSDLKACPYCDSDTYYTKDWVEGPSQTNIRFDGDEDVENGQMYDSVKHITGDRAYCRNCNRYIGDISTDTLSKSVIQHLKKFSI